MTTSGSGVQPKNVVYATLSAGSAAFLFGVIVLVKRTLGNDVFGAFQWALSLATIGEALMDFGIHQVTIRSIARDRGSARRIFQNSLALKVLPGALMFLVLGIVAFVCWPDRDLRIACLLMLVGAGLRSYLMTIRGVLLGLERFSDESLVVIGDRVFTLAAVALSLAFRASLVGVCLAFVVARVISVAGGFVLTHRQVGPPRPAFERDIWRELQINALPFGAFVVVLNVYNYIDTIFLGTMRGVGETGLYGQAYQIYQGLTYAPAILASVLIPRLSHLWSVDRAAHARLLRRSLAGTVVLALVLGGILWLLAPLLLTLAFDADAIAAVSALRILAGGLVFIFAIWILHAAAISVFGQQLMLRTTIIGVVANTAMNLWWIPRYGRDGAAWATVGGEALTLVLLAIGLRQFLTKNAGRGVTSAGV
jgi:O-antigen/teichoic acid export membrane protein